MTPLSISLHPPTIYATITPTTTSFYSHGNLQRPICSFKFDCRLRRVTCSSATSSSNSIPSGADSSSQRCLLTVVCVTCVAYSSFCIIEGPDTARDFVQMEVQEIQDNIRSRRNRIFLLMEEVRRLRVQQRMNGVEFDEGGREAVDEMPDMPSSIPFLPNLLEVKLGIGGTSYADFIRNMHLPSQLSQVDPIVASFSGGAVGVISCLMLIEANNVRQQEKKRCKYCLGTGYLACARCSSSGVVLSAKPISLVSVDSAQPLTLPTSERCTNCSGAGKVMCPACLCTGMIMASEHDPRIDPFD